MNIVESNKIFIHYGSDRFDPKRFKKVENIFYRNKPAGGLWASPVDAMFGWKFFCECNDFSKCDEANSFRFRLKPGNKVLELHDLNDISGYPEMKIVDAIFTPLPDEVRMDFEVLRDKYGVDAVDLVGDNTFRYALWGWDCESTVILNPDAIEIVEKGYLA